MRYVAALAVALVLATGNCVYANPYSLHRILIASYDAFDTPPDASGIVSIDGEAIDFQLPEFTLSSATIESLKRQLSHPPPESTAAIADRCVELVRKELNGVDTTRPSGAAETAETLIDRGTDYYSLCSEYALLLNEVLQACGVSSRVLWLEGHVATEYFDEDAAQWVYLDAQLNTLLTEAEGRRLSAATAIHRLERDEPVEFVPICSEAR